jgi:hypothetical protein
VIRGDEENMEKDGQRNEIKLIMGHEIIIVKKMKKRSKS